MSKHRFHCTVLRLGSRVWHWHWPRQGIVNCPRSALAARDPVSTPNRSAP